MAVDHSTMILFQLLRIISQNDLYRVVYNDSRERKKKKKRHLKIHSTFEAAMAIGSREAMLQLRALSLKISQEFETGWKKKSY